MAFCVLLALSPSACSDDDTAPGPIVDASNISSGGGDAAGKADSGTGDAAPPDASATNDVAAADALAKDTALAIDTSTGCVVTDAATTSAELLINGNAESGSLQGWTASGNQVAVVTMQSQQAGTVLPQQGSNFFTFAAMAGAAADLKQSGAGLNVCATLTLSGFVSTEDAASDDTGTATLRVLDADTRVLASVSSPALTSMSNLWRAFTITLMVPPGAARWEVALSGTRAFGTFTNVFWDNLTLTQSRP